MPKRSQLPAAHIPNDALASRYERRAFSLLCMPYQKEIVEFYVNTMRAPMVPHAKQEGVELPENARTWDQKHIAATWLTEHSTGKVPQPVEQTIEDNQQVKHIYEVRWLPPDPNDRSNYIEPIGGE